MVAHSSLPVAVALSRIPDWPTGKHKIVVLGSIAQTANDCWISAVVAKGVRAANEDCATSALDFFGRFGLSDKIGIPVVDSQRSQQNGSLTFGDAAYQALTRRVECPR